MADLTQFFGGRGFNHKTDTPEGIAPGDYPILIRKSITKPTKAGTGYYIYLEEQILDGPSKGEMVFDRLNIANDNKTAERIGYQRLGEITEAAGIEDFRDDAQLLNVSVIARIANDKGDPIVKKYLPLGGIAPPAAAPPMTPPAAPAAPVTPAPAPAPTAPVAEAAPAPVTNQAPVTNFAAPWQNKGA